MKKGVILLWRTLVYSAFFQLLFDFPGAVYSLVPGAATALVLSTTKVSDLMLIDYTAYRSPLRRIEGLYKLIFFLFCLLLSISRVSGRFSLSLFLFQAILMIGPGKVPLKRYLRFLEAPVMFLLMGAIGIAMELDVFPLSVSVSQASFFRAQEVTRTALCAISCLYSLSLSTPLNQLMQTLRKIKMPERMIELMIVLYRYIFVLFTMYYPMKRALIMRGGNNLRGHGMLWSSLFKRSYERADHSMRSMLSRGYDGSVQFLSVPVATTRGLFPMLVGMVLVLAGAWLL